MPTQIETSQNLTYQTIQRFDVISSHQFVHGYGPEGEGPFKNTFTDPFGTEYSSAEIFRVGFKKPPQYHAVSDDSRATALYVVLHTMWEEKTNLDGVSELSFNVLAQRLTEDGRFDPCGELIWFDMFLQSARRSYLHIETTINEVTLHTRMRLV